MNFDTATVTDRSTWPTPGIYRHFKGNTYHVLGTAIHAHALGTPHAHSVIYMPQHGTYAGMLAHRDLGMFLESVDRPHEHYAGPRFRFIEPRDFLSELSCRQSLTKGYRVVGISENTESHALALVLHMRDTNLHLYELDSILP